MNDVTQDQLSTFVGKDLPYLRRYARALTGNQARGDRFAAATLEAILADPSSFNNNLPPKVALFKIFHAIWSSADIPEGSSDTTHNPLELAAQERLSKLTPNTREALLMSTMEEMSAEDIGHIMALDQDDARHLIRTGLEEMANELKGRVMIIEDEPIIAMDIKGIVTDTGHQVTGIARTHTEAVNMAKADMPDLLLADVQLADGSSGIDAANEILAEQPDLPIVFITAYPERLLTGDRPEPAFLITKPFSVEQVHVAVSQSLFFASTAVLSR